MSLNTLNEADYTEFEAYIANEPSLQCNLQEAWQLFCLDRQLSAEK